MKDRLSRLELERILSDIRNEPLWRSDADRCAAYYDGQQLSSAEIAAMEDRGLPPLIRNLIAPAIDLVLGMEAKNRRDWKVVGNTDEYAELGEAVNVKYKTAQRTSKADQACSDAYAEQIKTGMSWVEIAWESNPFKPRYRVRRVHRKEISWDWRSQEFDLSDARYLNRWRWIDEDVVFLYFPQHAKRIKGLYGDTPDWDSLTSSLGDYTSQDLYNALGTPAFHAQDWWDTERRRYKVHEVWYRHWVKGMVMRLPGDRVVEFDKTNPQHQAVVLTGQVRLEEAVFARMRVSWWIGPLQLMDIPSPYPHNEFPYVPFWGLREDRSGAPYGLVRRMLSPQDEVNARLSRMMYLLSAKRIIADADAANEDWADIVDEAGRPDALLLLNPNRKNKTADAFRVETDLSLSAQQFSVMQDAALAIDAAGGISNALKGQNAGELRSGLALNSFVEQGSMSLAELNDNYATAKTLVGERLLHLVVADIGNEPETVSITFRGTQRSVTLNERSLDPDVGVEIINNRPTLTLVHMSLADVPDTPSYRAQVFQGLTELTKSLDPSLQAIVTPMVIRASDIPYREELASQIERHLGMGIQEPRTPEEAQQQAAQAEQEAYQQDLANRAAEADVAATFAKAEKDQADAVASRARLMGVQHDMILAEDKLGLDHDKFLSDAAQQAAKLELEQARLQVDARKAAADAKKAAQKPAPAKPKK